MLPHLTTQSPNTKSIMIIAYLGRNVKDYEKIFLNYLEELDLKCPECNGQIIDDHMVRVIIEEEFNW